MTGLKKIGNILMVVMLLAGGVTSFAATRNSMQEAAAKPHVTMGQITAISEHSLTLKDKNGKVQTFQITDPSLATGLKSGDKVSVASENGQASSIRKLMGTSSSNYK